MCMPQFSDFPDLIAIQVRADVDPRTLLDALTKPGRPTRIRRRIARAIIDCGYPLPPSLAAISAAPLPSDLHR